LEKRGKSFSREGRGVSAGNPEELEMSSYTSEEKKKSQRKKKTSEGILGQQPHLTEECLPSLRRLKEDQGIKRSK